MNRYIVIHGHFYQPPRENAWLDQIEIQESAAPYHDWNERISAECYGPNGVSRILNGKKQIVDIVNNYARMSFNFGPTLLNWMEQKLPKVYKSIIEADKISMELYDGHGSAMAQVYNHIIMPLSTRADKETQVKWGIYDFESRFGRKPEGMWLAETAVDTETLEILAENNIRFTVLAPNQAKSFRKKGTEEWIHGIETHRAYDYNLPSGKKITLFFYHGEKSTGVAFKGYLNDGKYFAEQLLSAFSTHTDESQLVHIATDGESYGHHHHNGDMALAFCMRFIEESKKARLTNYSQFLSLTSVTHEVQIHENSSWSCIHGVERWRSNCGCETGGRPGWNQDWRIGLRKAIDWLRDSFDAIYLKEMSAYHKDPGFIRNAYVQLMSDRSDENVQAFFNKYFGGKISPEHITRIIRLLEMQKNSLFMQTSCGWFFTEVSGIETVQILQYASRGIQLAEDIDKSKLEPAFLEILSTAKSNIHSLGTAADIYKKWVSSKKLSLTHIGMHYAVSSLFNDDQKVITVLNYDCKSNQFSRKRAGSYILATGATTVHSRLTRSEKSFHYAILYLGNHHLIGSTSTTLSQEEFDSITVQIEDSFERGNIAECIDIIKWNFLDKSFSFFHLFRDEQLKLLELVTRDLEQNALRSYEQVYLNSYGLLNVMRSENLRLPNVLRRNLEIVFQIKFEELFSEQKTTVSLVTLKRYAVEIRKWKVNIDTERVKYFASQYLSSQIDSFERNEKGLVWIKEVYEILDTLYNIDIFPGINELQDFIFRLVKENELEPDFKAEVYKLAELINLHFEKETSAAES